MFGETYRDKYEFVKKMFDAFKKIPSEIRINTSKIKPEEVCKIALDSIKILKIHEI